MSQNDETASGVEQDAQITGSVLDFLYHDARRVGSFLAQIDPSGHLTSLKQTEGDDSTSSMEFAGRATGGVPLLRGEASLKDQSSSGQRESLERTYDPLWTNAIALLDMLDERGMIREDLKSARIGQFVKVSGFLAVTDLTLWKGLWALPALKQTLTDNALAAQLAAAGPVRFALPESSQQRKNERRAKTAAAQQPTNAIEHQLEGALTVVGMLPHTIQARLMLNDGACMWCSLSEEGLVVSASDLTLKHGVTVSGRWTMVGVLDAYPDVGLDGRTTLSEAGAAAAASAVGGSPFGELMVALMPAIRGFLGRPERAHGITPLVIYREVSG